MFLLIQINGRNMKVKLFLRLIKHCAMNAYGGVDVQIHVFLDHGISWWSGQLRGLAALPLVKERPEPKAPEPIWTT
jgi:hypothetical protein